MLSSRMATASSRAGGVIGSAVGHELLSRSAAFALACWSAARLARCASVERGFASTLILDERVQLGSLFIVQEIVKLLQRRMNRLDGGNHRLDPLLHGREPLGRR